MESNRRKTVMNLNAQYTFKQKYFLAILGKAQIGLSI